MRRAAKIDGNQNDIVKMYRQLGFSVAVTSTVGDGFPDIVVGKNGYTELVEIKDPSQVPSKQKLTNDQVKFHNDWRGAIRVVKTSDDVLEHFRQLQCNK